MTELYYPLRSLREGHWFKLICGASYQHLPAVRHLTLAYTLAGADCIDVAADPAVIASALDALEVASQLGEDAQARGFGYRHRPLLMVSLNDGEDPHFRKAEFDPQLCPTECPRPCETICPAQAIVFHSLHDSRDREVGQPQDWKKPQSLNITPNSQNPKSIPDFSGVIDQRCYGCGRCLPICPHQRIYTRSYVFAPEAIAQLILPSGVDALEIHTKVGHLADFQRLWQAIAPWVDHLKLLAISCPDGEGLIEYLWAIHDLITPLPCPLIWQTDGRPMSGDIGIGATRAAVKLAQKVLTAGLPGAVQLAGGTNAHTVMKLRTMGLLNPLHLGSQEWGRTQAKDRRISPMQNPKACVAGIAYGSYARALLAPILEKLESPQEKWVDAHPVHPQNTLRFQSEMAVDDSYSHSPNLQYLEEFPPLLWQAVAEAQSLVSQLKPFKKVTQPTRQ